MSAGSTVDDAGHRTARLEHEGVFIVGGPNEILDTDKDRSSCVAGANTGDRPHRVRRRTDVCVGPVTTVERCRKRYAATGVERECVIPDAACDGHRRDAGQVEGIDTTQRVDEFSGRSCEAQGVIEIASGGERGCRRIARHEPCGAASGEGNVGVSAGAPNSKECLVVAGGDRSEVDGDVERLSGSEAHRSGTRGECCGA